VASPLPNIPVEFFNPLRKYELMNFLVGLGLPARVEREILQHWGEALGVVITAGDYQLLDNHLRTTGAGST
jgi:hypothetical protein